MIEFYDDEIIEKWQKDVLDGCVEALDGCDLFSVWVGFAIAIGRPDLADEFGYQEFGCLV